MKIHSLLIAAFLALSTAKTHPRISRADWDARKAAFLALRSAKTHRLTPRAENHLTARAEWEVGQTVQTTSGPVTGQASSNEIEVSEYLGIPFAKPPVGQLRFAPPEKFVGSAAIDGTKYSPSCPATQRFNFTQEKFDANNVSAAGVEFLQTLAQAGDTFSEDCLTVNVWTKPQVGEAKKAVLVWIYGGGFVIGNSDNLGYNGQYIVEREDVVLVSFNYRLNIFGFPGSPSATQNLGLLDQRLALEWIRDNIGSFGGDPSRITLFGQSAGGASVDYFSFAWTDDPIVSAFIPQSGTAVSLGQITAEKGSELWYSVASQLGCGTNTSDGDAVLACMRDIPDFKTIIEGISAAIPASALLVGSFGPTIDDKVVFSDYNERSLKGDFIQAPVLIGNTDYEGGLFQLITEIAGTPLPNSIWTGAFQNTFNCGASLRANVSLYHHLPIWRYRWFGTFPNTNLSTAEDLGAFHASELPIIFGITPFGEGIPANTEAEVALQKYVTGAWAAFAKDPVGGLSEYGWPAYEPGGQSLVRLGYEGLTGTNVVKGTAYDSACIENFPIAGNGSVPGNTTTILPSGTGGVGSPTGTGTVIPSSTSVVPVTSGGERSLGSVVLARLLVLILLLGRL